MAFSKQLLAKGEGLRDFKKLDIWYKAHQLVLKVYKETHNFPKEELIDEYLTVGRMLNSMIDKSETFCNPERRH